MLTLRLARLTVFLVALLGTGCSRAPDIEALCAKVAHCEDKPVSACVTERRELYEAQRARGCGDEGAAVVACEIEHGRCETGGDMTLFMPTETCRPLILDLGACFDRTRQ